MINKEEYRMLHKMNHRNKYIYRKDLIYLKVNHLKVKNKL